MPADSNRKSGSSRQNFVWRRAIQCQTKYRRVLWGAAQTACKRLNVQIRISQCLLSENAEGHHFFDASCFALADDYIINSMISDTHPGAETLHAEKLRRMTPQERVELCFQLSDDVRNVTLDGIRSRRPDLDTRGLRRELRRIMYGIELDL